jgi:hypothetical protein
MPLEAPIPVEQRGPIKELALEHLRRMLRFRTQYDVIWARFYRQYVSDRDQKYFPDGVTKRANTFIPYPFSNVETIVSRTHDVLFGYEDFFETTGYGMNDEPSAEKMQLVLKNKLHLAKLPEVVEAMAQSAAIYGPCAMKVDWDWDYDNVTYPEPVYAQQPAMQPVMDAQGQPQVDEQGQPQMQPALDQTGNLVMQNVIHPLTGQPIQTGIRIASKQVPRSRPKLIPIDVYDLLVDPDGKLSAFMTERTIGQLERENEGYKARFGYDLYYPEALSAIRNRVSSEKNPEEIIVRIAELWNEIDGTCAIMTFGEDKNAISWKDTRYAYRTGNSYSGFRRRLYYGEPELLWAGENYFAHKRNPIIWTSYSKLQHEQYGIGSIEQISDLVDALNDMTGMVRDNWNMGINRRYAYNTDMDIDHDSLNNMNVPGGKVGVAGNPTEAIMPLPLNTPQPGDYALLDLYKGMIEMTSGISDFYSKGVGGSGGNRTATGINSILEESNYRFKMFIRNLELDILQPMLEMCASNIQQFMTDEEEILITEDQPGIPKWVNVKPEELIGTLRFRLLGAAYMQNETLRQRNLMALANIAGNTPYLRERESLVVLGKAFKIPEINMLLKTDQEVQQEQQQQQQSQMEQMMLQHRMDMERIIVQAEARAAAVDPEQAAKDVGGGGGGSAAPSRKPAQSGGGKVGRPRTAQFEGTIPGGGKTSAARQFGQQLGANALGLGGMEEIPGA